MPSLKQVSIGFDIDGVIADFDRGLEEVFGPPPFPSEYSLRLKYPNVDAKALNEFVIDPKGYHNLRVIPGAKAGLTWLSNYASLFYVTARPGVPGMFRATWKWLFEKHNFPFGPLYLIAWEDKPKFVAGLGLDLYVEDSPEHIKNMRALGVTVVAYGQDWNQGQYPRMQWIEGDKDDAWDLIRDIARTEA